MKEKEWGSWHLWVATPNTQVNNLLERASIIDNLSLEWVYNNACFKLCIWFAFIP